MLSLLLLTACTSTPVGEDADDELAHALAGVIRLHYAQRLGDAVGADELRDSLSKLDGVLLERGAPRIGGEARPADAVAAARNAVVRGGYVFLPTPGSEEPGLSLARVLAREQGLERELWGRTVRYRRVEHDAPLVPSFPAYAALREGVGASLPLARHAGPTVYLDHAAIRRRAGERPYQNLTPEQLGELAELVEVAALRFEGDVHLEDLLVPAERAAALEGLHKRVLLTTLRYGDAAAALARLEALTEQRPGRPAALVAAAVWVKTGLSGETDPVSVRERVEGLFAEAKTR